MKQAGDAESEKVKLGPVFWTFWIAGFVVLTGLFLATMQWNMAQERWSTALATVATIVFTMAVWSLSMTPYILKRRRGERERIRLPIRRYMARFMPAMLAYAVLLGPAVNFYQEAKPTGLLAWAVALAPALPVLFAIWAILAYLNEEDDEFQRGLQVRAFVLATGLMMALSTTWGFLEMFSLAPHVPLWAVFPGWAVCLLPAQLVVRWKWR